MAKRNRSEAAARGHDVERGDVLGGPKAITRWMERCAYRLGLGLRK
jgi:hypothetical protein